MGREGNVGGSPRGFPPMRRDSNVGRSLFPLPPAGLGWDKAAPLGSAAAATFASWVRSIGDSPATPRGAVPERRCFTSRSTKRNCMVEMGERWVRLKVSITLLSEIDQLVRQRKIDQRRTQPTVRYERSTTFDHDTIVGRCVTPLSIRWRFDHRSSTAACPFILRGCRGVDVPQTSVMHTALVRPAVHNSFPLVPR